MIFAHFAKNRLTFSALAAALALGVGPAPCQYIGNASPVGVPRFQLRDGKIQCAGRAFAIQWFRGRKLLLAPLHLLGQGAGLPFDIAPQDVGREVVSLEVLDLMANTVITTAGNALLKTGAPAEKCGGDLSGDLMAFELPSNTKLPLLALCPTLVPVGTKVWVLSKEMHATSREVNRYPGVVVRSYSTGVTVEMRDSLTALSSSGAPVVNEKDQVVCMMVGKENDTRKVIMGIPSTSLYARLYREIGR